VALVRAAKALEKIKTDDEDVRTGVRLLARAMEEPLRRIAENAGVDGAVVIGKVEESKGSRGYNAATGKYEDLVAAGIIDPAKVVRTALQNAASVAALLLTTDAAVTDAPEPKRAAMPQMGGGGEDYDF
jgi:chaperonin GroEL